MNSSTLFENCDNVKRKLLNKPEILVAIIPWYNIEIFLGCFHIDILVQTAHQPQFSFILAKCMLYIYKLYLLLSRVRNHHVQ